MNNNKEAKQTPNYTVGSLEKGIKTLEILISNGPLSVAEAAKILGFNRSATHRFIATLKDMGYAIRDTTGKFKASLRLYDLGITVARGVEGRSEAHRIMGEINALFGETVNLGCIANDELVVIDIVKCQKPLKIELPLGSRGIAHATGLGKAILAYSDITTVKNCWNSGKMLKIPTENTINSFEELIKELEVIRGRGFAYDDEEWVEGIRCIAIPILDYSGSPIYSISISGPTVRMSKSVMLEMQKYLQEVSTKLSSQLGYQKKCDYE